MSRPDLADMIAHCGAHGDRVSDDFCDEPQLAALSSDELFQLAGMLLYLNSVAEARVVAAYAVEPLPGIERSATS